MSGGQVVKQLVVSAQANMNPRQHHEKVALFDSSGAVVDVLTALSAEVELTGYSVGANTAVAATDSINEAIGKLQGQINALVTLTGSHTTELADHESRLDVLEA